MAANSLRAASGLNVFACRSAAARIARERSGIASDDSAGRDGGGGAPGATATLWATSIGLSSAKMAPMTVVADEKIGSGKGFAAASLSNVSIKSFISTAICKIWLSAGADRLEAAGGQIAATMPRMSLAIAARSVMKAAVSALSQQLCSDVTSKPTLVAIMRRSLPIKGYKVWTTSVHP